MSMKNLLSGICWVLMAFIVLIALWVAGALHASDSVLSSADQTIQNKKQVPDKNIQEKGERVGLVEVNMVTTDVSIIGKPTSELRHEEFLIYDNGIGQEMIFFSKDSPIAMALLIDAGSSTKPYMPEMQLAAIAALRHLNPDDKVVLYSFGSVVRRHTELTNNFAMAADSLSGIEINNGEVLCDAIVEASEYLSKKAPNYSRRVIILISDNQSGSTINADRALDKLLKTSTSLYNILIQRTNASHPGRVSQEPVLLIPKMVEETGGEIFDIKKPGALQDALSSAILNIQRQFTLGFLPPNPGKAGIYHKLEIKLASKKLCPGCIILFRKGYYY